MKKQHILSDGGQGVNQSLGLSVVSLCKRTRKLDLKGYKRTIMQLSPVFKTESTGQMLAPDPSVAAALPSLSLSQALHGVYQTHDHAIFHDLSPREGGLPGGAMSGSLLRSLAACGVSDLYMQCPADMHSAAQDLAKGHLDKTRFINEFADTGSSRAALGQMAEMIGQAGRLGMTPHFFDQKEELAALQASIGQKAPTSPAEEMAQYLAQSHARAAQEEMGRRFNQASSSTIGINANRKTAWMVDGDDQIRAAYHQLQGGVVHIGLAGSSQEAEQAAQTTPFHLIAAKDALHAGTISPDAFDELSKHVTSPQLGTGLPSVPAMDARSSHRNELSTRTPSWYSPPLSISLG